MSLTNHTVYENEMKAASELAAARRDAVSDKSFKAACRVLDARQVLIAAIDAVDMFELQQDVDQDAQVAEEAANIKLELLVLSDMQHQEEIGEFWAHQ